MEFGRDSSLPNQFWHYTIEDELEEEMTSANHASQTLKMELGMNPGPPNKLEEEMTSVTHASQNSKMEFERDPRRAKSVSVHFWRQA